MKIKTEHYKELEYKLHEILNEYPNKLQEYRDQGRSDEQFRWDLLHFSDINIYSGGLNLYSYLNDDNIDTALRKITGTD